MLTLLHDFWTWLHHFSLWQVWAVGAVVPIFLLLLTAGIVRFDPETTNVSPDAVIGILVAIAIWPLTLTAALAVLGIAVTLATPVLLGWLIGYPYHEHKRRLEHTKARLNGEQRISA